MKRSVVPYNRCYILPSRSHPKCSCLTNSLIGCFISTVLAALTPPNEHKFCSYMVHRTFSSRSHRQAIRINKRRDRRYKAEEIDKIIDETPWIWKPSIDKLKKFFASEKR